MKRLFSVAFGLFAALVFSMLAGQANAITTGTVSSGQLVPSVVHNGSNVDTVVGITNADYTLAIVYWTFFNVDGNPVTHGQFTIPAQGYYPFDWKGQSSGLANQEGYLVFTTGDSAGHVVTTGHIVADAFLVDFAAKDAAFVPVLPLDGTNDYRASINLNSMGSNAIIMATYTNTDSYIVTRYWIDPQWGATTKIKLWTVCNVSSTPIKIMDSAGNYTNSTFNLAHARLNTIDPSTLASPPSSLDGRIGLNPAHACDSGATYRAVAFSYISSTAVGATQTILGAQYP